MTKKNDTPKPDAKVKAADITDANKRLSATYRSIVSAEEWAGGNAWRLAEIIQMRRMFRSDRNGQYAYYECQLCGGKSALALPEIRHEPDCPVERMRKG